MHPLRQMIEMRKTGTLYGIPSYCTGNSLAIEAALIRAKITGTPVLIEATANQVNQYGGYTGMQPADFYKKVVEIGKEVGVPESQIIFGGDHLGPLTWQDEKEDDAMLKADQLVYAFVKAGFTKIHLDTSMKLADDPEGPLDIEVISRRGVRLYETCMQAYRELKEEKEDALRPVFVIGSEVPIPGGAQEKENSLEVTKSEAFRETVRTYQRCFATSKEPDGWNDIIAVVVQPGVEFGDDQVFLYDREKASFLCETLREFPDIVFEGHSTDYQTPGCLKQMVEDGIAILKVGPALTFGLREAVFSLAFIEKELVPEKEQSGFIEELEKEMLANPVWWQKHYHGNEKALYLSRKYSFSDRARYYMGTTRVMQAMEKLFENLRKYEIPMNMMHQYMPAQFEAIRSGMLEKEPKALALYGIMLFMKDYEYAGA